MFDQSSMMELLALVISGAGVGLAVGMTGVGGGALMTPLLIWLGIPTTTAVGTDLIYAAATKSSSVWVNARRSTIEWPIVKHLLFGSIPGALMTVGLIDYFDVDREVFSKVITQALSFALFLTAIMLLLRTRIIELLRHERLQPVRDMRDQMLPIVTMLCGFAIGILVTITSVGAGVLGTTLVLLLYPRLPTLTVIGTEVAHAVPLTLVAGLGHLHLGNVDWQLLVCLLIGSLPGAYIGSKLAARVSDRILRPVLAAMLLGIGIQLLMS